MRYLIVTFALLCSLGSACAQDVADMVSITTRQVYNVPISAAGISANPVDTTAISNYIAALTVNPEVDQYDWSGTSVFTRFLRTINGTPTWQVGGTVPATLITATHAIASDHNGPLVGDTCYWRTPAGSMVSATAAEVTVIAGDLRLVRFGTNPSAALKRYAICTDASLVDYVADHGAVWCLHQEQLIRLRVLVDLPATGTDVRHEAEQLWNSSIGNGSGRPAFVPLTNNELVITGALWRQWAPYVSNSRTSASLTAIQAELTEHGETLSTVALPAGNYSGGPGDGQEVGYSTFAGKLFGTRQR